MAVSGAASAARSEGDWSLRTATPREVHHDLLLWLDLLERCGTIGSIGRSTLEGAAPGRNRHGRLPGGALGHREVDADETRRRGQGQRRHERRSAGGTKVEATEAEKKNQDLTLYHVEE